MLFRKLYPILLLLAGVGIGVLLTKQWRNQEPKSTPTVTERIAQSQPGTSVGEEPDKRQSSNRDPGSSLANALANPDRDGRGEGLRRLATELVQTNIKDALALGAKIPDESDRLDYTRAVFAAWAMRDPGAAVAYAKDQMSPGLLQSEALGAVLEKWGAKDARSAYAWLDENLSGPLKEQGMTSLIQGWSRVDPAGAAAWFIATGSTSQTALNALVTTWSDLNPRDAANWIEFLSDPTNKATARVSLVSEWARQNPEQAAEYAKPWLGGPQGMDVVTALIGSWETTNPASAAAWIENLETGNVRNEAAANLTTIWAASDIQAAVRWTEKLSEPSLKAEVIDHLSATWGAIEPEKALAWLETLPADELRRGATEGALNSWAATDPTGMERWIQSQPPGERSDAARQSLGEVEVDRSPAMAMELALGAKDPVLRQDLLVKFYRHWSRKDGNAAGAWLQSAGLSPDLRERLSNRK